MSAARFGWSGMPFLTLASGMSGRRTIRSSLKATALCVGPSPRSSALLHLLSVAVRRGEHS
eukprot:5082928-Heterocapsa_arctica.AAC.1